MTPRPLSTITIKEGEDGSTVVLRTDRGAQVHYGPFAADGVEAAILHLGSALAMTAMRYQTVLRGANFGGRRHEQGLPEETRDKREEIAVRLAEAMVRERGGDEPTQARAVGATISRLIGEAPAPKPDPGPLDWMDWERRKALRLLLPESQTA